MVAAEIGAAGAGAFVAAGAAVTGVAGLAAEVAGMEV